MVMFTHGSEIARLIGVEFLCNPHHICHTPLHSLGVHPPLLHTATCTLPIHTDIETHMYAYTQSSVNTTQYVTQSRLRVTVLYTDSFNTVHCIAD